MLLVTASACESSTVNIYDHRHLTRNLFGSENVEEKAILAVSILLSLSEFFIVELLFGHVCLVIEGAGLIGASSVFGSLVNAVPMSYLGRILKATCGSVSYALIRYYTAYPASCAANGAAGSVYNMFHIFYLLTKNLKNADKTV
jgi:hypothetical protein